MRNWFVWLEKPGTGNFFSKRCLFVKAICCISDERFHQSFIYVPLSQKISQCYWASCFKKSESFLNNQRNCNHEMCLIFQLRKTILLAITILKCFSGTKSFTKWQEKREKLTLKITKFQNRKFVLFLMKHVEVWISSEKFSIVLNKHWLNKKLVVPSLGKREHCGKKLKHLFWNPHASFGLERSIKPWVILRAPGNFRSGQQSSKKWRDQNKIKRWSWKIRKKWLQSRGF